MHTSLSFQKGGNQMDFTLFPDPFLDLFEEALCEIIHCYACSLCYFDGSEGLKKSLGSHFFQASPVQHRNQHGYSIAIDY